MSQVVAVKKIGFWFSIVLMVLLLSACTKSSEQISLTGKTMGTYYSIKYIAKENIPARSQIQLEIDSRLAQVNSEMSTYQQDSELSKFNQSRSTAPFDISFNTAQVVTEAIRLNALTKGALDITVGPLVNLWGFGPQMRVEKKPTAIEIETARAKTGISLIEINASQLSKTNPEVYLDLSSIAKGFAVDYVAQYLEQIGINNYLVEIGGELQLKGINQKGQPWKIAIEKPQAGEQSVQEIIAPGDMAIATSGDYRNYFEQDGIRYSHIINPKTAKPINHRLVSVTILDKSCMTADGLATAFMVLGAEKGLALANQENIPAFFIVKTDQGFAEIASESFKPYLTNNSN